MLTRAELLDILNTAVAVRAKQSGPIPAYTGREPPHEALCKILKRKLLPKLDREYPNLRLSIRWFLGALSYFTPEEISEIPRPLIAHCLCIVRDRLRQIQGTHSVKNRSKTVKNIVDIALALAVSWKRKPIGLGTLWDRPWKPAFQLLTEMSARIVERICRGFDADGGWIIGAPRGFYYPGKDTVRAWAGYIVTRFVFDKSKPKPEYTKYQVLETWEPGRAPLEHWFTRALQGTPGDLKQVEANKFSHGLLYDPMYNGRQMVRVGKVAFDACKCGYHKMEFGTPCCDKCKRILEPKSYYVIRKDLLIIPGVYLTTKFRQFKPQQTQVPKTLQNVIYPTSRKKQRPVYFIESLGKPPHKHKSISPLVTHLYVQSHLLSCIDQEFAITTSNPHGDKDGEMEVEPITYNNPDLKLNIQDEKMIIEKVCNELPNLQKIVFDMHINGISFRKISKKTGLKKDEIIKVLRETKGLLKAKLEPLLYDI